MRIGRTAAWITVPLLLANPWAIYLSHNGYPLWATEALLGFAAIAAIGMMIGVLADVTGAYLGSMILGGVVALVVDCQGDWISSWTDAITLWVAASAAITVLRKLQPDLASRLLPTVSGVMLLATFVAPSGPKSGEWRKDEMNEAGAASLPPILHLILDEHIGIEGIPAEFDPERRIANRIRDFYLDRDFRVFGRAYSRYYNTSNSLSNLVNLTASEINLSHFGGEFKQGMALRSNAYFDALKGRGYTIDVVQTNYIDFCGAPASSPVSSCRSIPLETVGAIREADLSPESKAKVMAGSFLRLSFVLSYLKKETSLFSFLVRSSDRFSALAALPVFKTLDEVLRAIRPGQMVFAHVMLPHYPFIYTTDCRIRENVEEWLNGFDENVSPMRNDRASRARRYPYYLEQLACIYSQLEKLFSSPSLESAWIVVHGDHGSRLTSYSDRTKHSGRFTRSDFLDGFSTLFAYRAPFSTRGTYDPRMLPIDRLLKGIVEAGKAELNVRIDEPPTVFMKGDKKGSLVKRPMPPFKDGAPL